MNATVADIGAWSFKVDLGKYAFLLQHCPTESSEALAKIQNRDYASIQAIRAQMLQMTHLTDVTEKIRWIHRRIETVAHVRRNVALQKFIDEYIAHDIYHRKNSAEQQSYAALVGAMTQKLSAGEVLSEDLRVAAQVASGALRRDSLVMALMRSAIHMNQSIQKGQLRTKTTRFMDHDALGLGFSESSISSYIFRLVGFQNL